MHACLAFAFGRAQQVKAAINQVLTEMKRSDGIYFEEKARMRGEAAGERRLMGDGCQSRRCVGSFR